MWSPRHPNRIPICGERETASGELARPDLLCTPGRVHNTSRTRIPGWPALWRKLPMAQLRWGMPAGLPVAAVIALAVPADGASETGQSARVNAFRLFVSSGVKCPFCADERGPTMVADYQQAAMVLYGHFENAKVGPGGDI